MPHATRPTVLTTLTLTLACGPFADPIAQEDALEQSVGPFETLECQERAKVDVLFVIADDPASADLQPRIAELLAQVGEGVEEYVEHYDFSYRFAVTSAHVPSGACTGAQSQSVEGGAFVTTPCVDRLDDFITADPLANDSDRTTTCTDWCSPEQAATVTQAFSSPTAKPWVERRDTVTHTPTGAEPETLLACVAPQGIAGCRYPAPIAAARRAIERSLDREAPEYGFLRPDATLKIAFVGGVPDCSLAPDGEAIFDPDGSRVFWSNPDGPPTPAICWNAGVQCSDAVNSGSGDCWATNKTITGADAIDPDDAVLQPVPEMIDFLESLIAERLTRGIEIAVLGGGPPSGSLEPLPYTRVCDPAWRNIHGICPGCEVDGLRAPPPARLRALAAAFPAWRHPGPLVLSACHDHSGYIRGFVHSKLLIGHHDPRCIEECVADTDLQEPGVQPECLFRETLGDGTVIELPPCVVDGDIAAPPPGRDTCVLYRTDKRGDTPSELDDVDKSCISEGLNLSYSIVRTRPPPDVSCVSATCLLSDHRNIDCPEML